MYVLLLVARPVKVSQDLPAEEDVAKLSTGLGVRACGSIDDGFGPFYGG